MNKNKKKNLFSCIKSVFKNKSKNVAILNLHGLIGAQNIGLRKASLSIHGMKKDIDKAFAIKDLLAVALSINSPGGAPVQAEFIAKYISNLSNKKKIPVFSFIEDVAASGGYWLACISKEIYASRSSIVGSIGVISSGFGFTEAIKKLGIERRVITQGKNKSIYDPFLPEKDTDKKIIAGVQKDIHEEFKKLVKNSRGKKLKGSEDKVFNGEFWSGSKALDLGLIDEIGDIYTVMESKFGQEIKFHILEKKQSWIKKKLGITSTIDSAVDTFFIKLKEIIIFNKFNL